MALTRNFLKGLSLTDEQVSAIIEAHTETTDALKQQRDAYKADADRLPEVQRELDALKNGTDWKAKHDQLQSDFDAYKAQITAREARATKAAAFCQQLTDAHIPEKFHARILKLTDLDALEMDGESLKDPAAVQQAIVRDWGEYRATEESHGADVDTPPDKPTNAFASLSLADKMRYANEHPGDAAVRAWLDT